MSPALIVDTQDAALARLISAGLEAVAKRLADQMRSPIPAAQRLVEHSAAYRGKMVRPSVAILSGLAATPPSEARFEPLDLPNDLVTVAGVVELIHLATLVHDDVLDEADVRRGSPTICNMAGNEAAVMLGDYLIARAFHLCSQIDDQRIALRVGEITSQVCEGELLQLANRGNWAMDERTYDEIIERKTAALIAVGCELGAAVSGAPRAATGALWRFGLAIGKAFQVQDDLLDLTASKATIGKPVGRDAEKGKPTLAIIRYLEGLAPAERSRTIAALESGDPGLASKLDDAGALDAARAAAEALVDDAKGELGTLPDSPARTQLAAMADAVVHRER